MGSYTENLKTILCGYHIGNILLSLLFFFMKTCPGICDNLFEDCKLDIKEWEWLTFLGCVIVMKNRKQASFAQYVGTTCMFAKILNIVLFFKQNPVYSVFYILLCLVHMVFFPEPVYTGPQHITYFRGVHLEETMAQDRRVIWVITFYASWSPACVSFAPVFAEISSKYSLENLKFGKLDVTKYPDIAAKHGIDTQSWSKQLPTLILFEECKEKIRRPYVDIKARISKFAFSMENVTADFDLKDRHMSCKKHLAERKKRKPKNE